MPLMPPEAVAQNIQLALAPVFLLTGVASVLNVLSARLARVVDRARRLEEQFLSYDANERLRASAELKVLGRRMAVAHWAIGLCTCSALLVCVVVALIFVSDLIAVRLSAAVAPLFIVTMALLIGGLLLFLYELQIATNTVRVRGELLERV